MKLSSKQRLFAKLFGIFIVKLHELGYEVIIGEIKRTQAQADANAKSGLGISNSLHIILLAADIELFKHGKWLQYKEDYKEAAEVWVSLHSLCRAGYYWKNTVDPFHFSLAHGGRE